MKSLQALAVAYAILAASSAFAAPCMAPTPACAAQLPPAPPLPAKPAHKAAPPVQYDPNFAQQREMFLKIYSMTAKCMVDASSAMLREGSRDQEQIERFSVSVCSQVMAPWLKTKENMSDHKAYEVLHAMATKALQAVLENPELTFEPQR